MQDIRRRGRMVAYGTDVTIGEVTIRTGDALVADANGIIAVSSDDLPTVLERLEAGADDESAVQEGLAEGKSAVAMFRERGRF